MGPVREVLRFRVILGREKSGEKGVDAKRKVRQFKKNVTEIIFISIRLYQQGVSTSQSHPMAYCTV